MVNDEPNDAARNRNRCACPGFPESGWVDSYMCGFMGGINVSNPKLRPCERNDEGSPGSWYRSRFVASLMKYLPTDHGPNYLLAECGDRLIHDAVRLYMCDSDRLASMSIQDARNKR